MSEFVAAFCCGGAGETPKPIVALPDECPKCGAATVLGYGLAGGGFGAYVSCSNDVCDFFAKHCESVEPGESP